MPRLHRLMASRGLCSRREAEALIAAGRVQVDGALVSGPVHMVSEDCQIQILDRSPGEQLAILLNKPPGYVSTQPEADQEPAHLLLTERSRCIHPLSDSLWQDISTQSASFAVAGRLDRASRGLLLMTRCGALARAVTAGNLVKRYSVQFNSAVDTQTLSRLRAIRSLDAQALKPMHIQHNNGSKGLRFDLREGKRHQIRRCCASLGLHIIDLYRQAIGPLDDQGLAEGQWRLLGDQERQALIRASPV